MNKPSSLPIAVQNLRKIWDTKRLEMQFTQVQAAKDLNWTQGAISHYLNAQTELNPAAIIKLANFLDVDPIDIDPSIEKDLPNVQSYKVAFDASDVTKRVKKTHYSKFDPDSEWVSIKKSNSGKVEGTNKVLLAPAWPYECMIQLCKPTALKNPKMWAVRLKQEKHLRFYYPQDLPPVGNIQTKWAVVNVLYV